MNVTLNDTQTAAYNALLVKIPAGHTYEYDTLAELKDDFPLEFADVELDVGMESVYLADVVSIVRKIYPNQCANLSDEDIIKFPPMGAYPIIGSGQYLKYARILKTPAIYTDPYYLTNYPDVLETVSKHALLTHMQAIGEGNTSMVLSVLSLAGSLKTAVKTAVDAFKGSVVEETDPVSDRPKTLGSMDSTKQSTMDEEMEKRPHAIKSFGEPLNTADPEYPHNHRTVTDVGHIFEMDDTPSSPRIRFQHYNGAGMQVNGDGHMIVKSVEDRYDVTLADAYTIVKGYTTEVHQDKVLRTFEKGIMYKTKYQYTEAEERVHYQTPVVSYNSMLLGKNAIFSNSVLVKDSLTTDSLFVETETKGKLATYVVTRANWNNALSRESTVAWDIASGGGDTNTIEMPSTPPDTRNLIFNSIKFKSGASGDPTFLKRVSFEKIVEFENTIMLGGAVLTVVGGRLAINGRPVKFADES